MTNTTGWPPGLLQDDSRELARWFSTRPDARRVVREVAHQIEEQRMTTTTDNLPPLYYDAKTPREMADYVVGRLRDYGSSADSASVCFVEHLCRAALAQQSPTTDKAVREAFEAWATARQYNIRTFEGDYYVSSTCAAWAAWQAALASSAPLSEATVEGLMREAVWAAIREWNGSNHKLTLSESQYLAEHIHGSLGVVITEAPTDAVKHRRVRWEDALAHTRAAMKTAEQMQDDTRRAAKWGSGYPKAVTLFGGGLCFVHSAAHELAVRRANRRVLLCVVALAAMLGIFLFYPS